MLELKYSFNFTKPLLSNPYIVKKKNPADY